MAPSHRLYLFGKSALLATLTITVAASLVVAQVAKRLITP